MTDKQREEFVKQVKGERIRWSGWPKGDYFIPNGEYDVDKFYGTNENGRKDFWYIHEGFNKSKNGGCWEFCGVFNNIVIFLSSLKNIYRRY